MAKRITLPDVVIISKIYLIRGQKVMIDRDLAELYGVETKNFKASSETQHRAVPGRFYVRNE